MLSLHTFSCHEMQWYPALLDKLLSLLYLGKKILPLPYFIYFTLLAVFTEIYKVILQLS